MYVYINYGKFQFEIIFYFSMLFVFDSLIVGMLSLMLCVHSDSLTFVRLFSGSCRNCVGISYSIPQLILTVFLICLSASLLRILISFLMFQCCYLILEVTLYLILSMGPIPIHPNVLNYHAIHHPYLSQHLLQKYSNHEKYDQILSLSFFQINKISGQFISMCLEPYQLNFVFYISH